MRSTSHRSIYCLDHMNNIAGAISNEAVAIALPCDNVAHQARHVRLYLKGFDFPRAIKNQDPATKPEPWKEFCCLGGGTQDHSKTY